MNNHQDASSSPSFLQGLLIKALARYSVARPPPFFGGPWLCVHPPHDGVALLAALLRKMRLLLDLLSASGESDANIISESQCLVARLALSTELPRRGILANQPSRFMQRSA